MGFKKPIKRTDTEWQAFKAWRTKPVEAVKTWFGVTPDDWQGDILNGMFNEKDRVAYKAAHGVGKTTIDAWAGWIFLNCYENCRVVATAPTIHQLTDALLPEYAKWHSKMPERMKNEWNISGQHIRHKIAPYEWFLTARTSNKPANLQGFHNENLLIQADEMSAIPDNVFEVMEGALSEAGDEGKTAKFMGGGNPNFASGELYHVFNRNNELYHAITITGDPEWFASLHIKQGDFVQGHGYIYYSPRVRPKYVKTMALKYGKDSAIFDVRVRGIFPREDDDCVIPWTWAEAARGQPLPQFDSHADGVTIIVDPSRGGGAETAIGWFRRGICVHLRAFKNGSTSTKPVIDAVKEDVLKIIKLQLPLTEIIVDEPGIGGAVIDRLREDNLPVKPYNGGKPMVTGVDPADDCRQFKNRRSRDWWNVRRKLELGEIPLPDDETLIGQLTTLKKHYTSDEKIICESKEDLKSRLGKEASPDRADVIVMGTAIWYEAAAVHGQLTMDDIYAAPDGNANLYLYRSAKSDLIP
jgi:phage terminase large subunit